MMARVPTPIPESVVEDTKRFFSGGVADVLWKVFVVAVGTVLLGLILALNPGFFVAALVGMVLSVVFSDNIRAFVSDVWNRNFWVWRT
jgi:ABC-type nitrate/sulfonate/bicarbonate transport system permease component